MKKITVLYNEVSSLSCDDKNAILTEAGAKQDARSIAKALTGAGYKADIMELNLKTVTQLKNKKADLFFNLCDGIGSRPKTEHKVPEVLDRLHLPYTGSDAAALLLTTNKALTKTVFEQNGIPTPSYALFESGPMTMPKNLEFPLIIKPVAEDCSLGISPSSVVENMTDLRKEVNRVVSRYHQPALAEKYIKGRELNVTIIGNGRTATVLPIAEIIFGNYFKGGEKPRVVDFKAKWVENSGSYKATNSVCPANISEKLKNKIEKLAIQAYLVCGGRDYARVDIRLSREGIPYFLEINLNPDISRGMGASKAANAKGWNYDEFIGNLAYAAQKRYRL